MVGFAASPDQLWAPPWRHASSMVYAAPSGSTGVGALTEQMPESGVLLGRDSRTPGARPYPDGSWSLTSVT